MVLPDCIYMSCWRTEIAGWCEHTDVHLTCILHFTVLTLHSDLQCCSLKTACFLRRCVPQWWVDHLNRLCLSRHTGALRCCVNTSDFRCKWLSSFKDQRSSCEIATTLTHLPESCCWINGTLSLWTVSEWEEQKIINRYDLIRWLRFSV